MEELEPKTVSEAKSSQGDLAGQIESLRQMLTSVLVLVIVISGTLNIYLWRQVRYTRADLAAFRGQASALVGEFEQKSAPMMKEFFARLVEFDRSPRADEAFHAIMKKYGLSNFTNAPSAPPAQAPVAPATTPVQAPAKK